jgi:hypothetical protein
MMSEKMGPIISTNGLVFCVDAANPQSIVSGQTIWKDLTFNTTGGTLTNGVIFTGTGVSSGLSYDGTDDYISNINGVSTTNQISVNAWIRPRSVNNFQHIVDASNNTWHLAILNTNNVYFWDGFNYQRSGATVNANFNYMVTGVRNTTTNRIYLNGSLTESIAGTNNISTNTINISRWQGINTGATPSRYFTGTTYGVQIYDRGITPFEVFQNFNAMKGRYGIPDIVTGGLVLNLDAGNPYSYNPDNTGSTVWTDVSYTSSGGTLINGAYYSGGTMVFDGVDDYVDTTYTANTGNNFSFGTVCKPTTVGQSLGGDILAKNYSSGSPYTSWGVDFLSDRTFRFIVADGTVFSFVTSTPQTLNQIYYLFVTYQNKIITAYINGISVGTKTNTNDPVYNDHTLSLGVWKETPPNNYFVGNIYTAQVYNRALSASEVQQNFNALRGRYGI